MRRTKAVQIIGSFFLLGTALFNLLDMVSTFVGLGVGLVESVPASAFVLNAFGPWAWIAEKVAYTLAAILAWCFLRSRWEKKALLESSVILLVSGVIFLEFASISLSNIILIIQKALG